MTIINTCENDHDTVFDSLSSTRVAERANETGLPKWRCSVSGCKAQLKVARALPTPAQ